MHAQQEHAKLEKGVSKWDNTNRCLQDFMSHTEREPRSRSSVSDHGTSTATQTVLVTFQTATSSHNRHQVQK